MKSYFEGNFRRTQLQSLGGSSVETNRIQLIKKAQDERKKREDLREEKKCCNIIIKNLR